MFAKSNSYVKCLQKLLSVKKKLPNNNYTVDGAIAWFPASLWPTGDFD